ncbi:MAG: hypothetical protein OHK0017_02190 [Patescibacteria group bacterium]
MSRVFQKLLWFLVFGSIFFAVGATTRVYSIQITNTADVNTPSTESNLENNTASVTDELVRIADLKVYKTDGKDFTFTGKELNYEITVWNDGPSTVKQIKLEDKIPDSLDRIKITPQQGKYEADSGIWDGLELAAGSSIKIFIQGTVKDNARGLIVNTVKVSPPDSFTDPNPRNNTSTDWTRITGLMGAQDVVNSNVDLEVKKYVDKVRAKPGDDLNYDLKVKNLGKTGATEIVLTDTLPESAKFISARYKEVIIQPAEQYVRDGQRKLIFRFAYLESGQEISISIQVKMPDKDIINQASVISYERDINLANNLAEVSTQKIVLRVLEGVDLIRTGGIDLTMQELQLIGVWGVCGLGLITWFLKMIKSRGVNYRK